jgi:hypothetical protein
MKYSFCEKCLSKGFHTKNHNLIKYPINIKELDIILEEYKINLNKAFVKLNQLIKLKYARKLGIKKTNLFKIKK